NQRAIRKEIFRPVAELFDEAENVIPASAVQPAGVLAQLVENFLALEGAEDRLDQDRCAHTAAGNAERGLRVDEDIVPQPGLEMTLHLRQVKIGAAAPRQQLLRVVEKIESPVKERRRHAFAAEQHMLLLQVPAARA